MDVAASEFYTEEQTYDLNFKEEVNVSFFPLKFFEVLMPPFMMLVSLCLEQWRFPEDIWR